MRNREKMLFQLEQLMAVYNNLIKTSELCNDAWGKDVIEKNASNLLMVINNLEDILKTIND